MNLWGHVFARCYDRCMAATEDAGMRERRRSLLAEVGGSVIEIGAGTGANLTHYPAHLEQLVLVEPESPMVARIHRRLADHPRADARIVQAPAERIPLPDASFDVAVTTLVLCTVAEPRLALAELRRLLKPDGRLLFIEHVRADDPAVARWQDRLQPLWGHIGHGCHCNRDTLASIHAAGFSVQRLETGRVPKAPAIVRPMITGAATA